MTRAEFEQTVLDLYGVSADYPFEDDFTTGVFRHLRSGKWFALAMNISEEKLGRCGKEPTDVVNMKCAPEVIESIVGVERGVYPAYHMNKMHWLSVDLAECEDGMITWLLGISYDLTSKTSKKGGQKTE